MGSGFDTDENRAFARTGTAYQKKGDLGKAIEYYQKSLTEHRTPDVLTKLRAVEKAKIESEKQAYIDPAKAEEAREEGNKHFKEANWPEAVKCYTEMIKRAPEDPRGYSNLAVALTKLGSFPEAVRNCDIALKLDPHFMRAHIRKAQACFAMREYSKCLDALSTATEADTDGKSHGEIEALQRKCLQVMYSAREGETEEQTMERIQRDPDVSISFSKYTEFVSNYFPDCQHHPGPRHAEHPPAGQVQPCCSQRPHEEPYRQAKDPKVDGRGHYPRRLSGGFKCFPILYDIGAL